MTTADVTRLVLAGDAETDPELAAAAAAAVESLQRRVPDLTLPKLIRWRSPAGWAAGRWVEVMMSDDPNNPDLTVRRQVSREALTDPDRRDAALLRVFSDLLHRRTGEQDRKFQRMLAEWHGGSGHGDGG